jgi:hypothetical protein
VCFRCEINATQASKCVEEVILGGVYEGNLRVLGILSLEQQRMEEKRERERVSAE